ncbi:hypothetical protein [Klebsiella oxytoca]|uniref:hypothetical protein n=1 Tax=Klebsiella oxytoca TaxID=571 RepID=UPI0038790FC6
MFLDNFFVWNEFRRFKLILNKHDNLAQTRHIYLDLTNQNLSQSNYLNDLVSASSTFACDKFFINVNAVSPALRNNLPAGCKVVFLDANKEPEHNDDGYDFYYQIYEPENEYNSEPCGYVPQIDSLMSLTHFETYSYER